VLDDCSGVSGLSETDFADPKTFQASLVISKERPPWPSGIAHLKFATLPGRQESQIWSDLEIDALEIAKGPIA